MGERAQPNQPLIVGSNIHRSTHFLQRLFSTWKSVSAWAAFMKSQKTHPPSLKTIDISVENPSPPRLEPARKRPQNPPEAAKTAAPKIRAEPFGRGAGGMSRKEASLSGEAPFDRLRALSPSKWRAKRVETAAGLSRKRASQSAIPQFYLDHFDSFGFHPR